MRDTVEKTPEPSDLKLLLEVKMHSTTRRLKKRTVNNKTVTEAKPIQHKVPQQKSPMNDL
jgi:hypothetical protein